LRGQFRSAEIESAIGLHMTGSNDIGGEGFEIEGNELRWQIAEPGAAADGGAR
jgi:hypothetical protein